MIIRISLLAALALGAAGVAHAQMPPPLPPGGAPLPARSPDANSTANGRVKQLIINPNGDVDGLLLANGTQVNFPPHLTASLVQIVHLGDMVSVQGFRAPDGSAIRASVITNSVTGRSVADQPPPPDRPPPAPPALTALTAEGRVTQLLHADMGELNGAILDDGTIVRWPPPFGVQLQSLLAANPALRASGFGTQNGYGRALEATSIAVNGQAPITVYGPAPGRAPAPPLGPVPPGPPPPSP